MPRTSLPTQLARIVLSTLSCTTLMLTNMRVAAAEPTAPAQGCDTQQLQQTTGFEMRFDARLRNAVVGQRVQAPIVVRFPKNGAELHAATELRCEGLIPRGAHITQLQITQVTGLPRGVTWRSAKADLTFAGGESACFWLEGTPETVGQHTIEISSFGSGVYMGLSTTNRCTLRIHDIVVASR